MPIRLCLEPTCDQPVAYRGRCIRHASQHDRQTNRAGTHIYATKKWKITRRHQLILHPLCAKCGAIAEDVHHITDLADGGAPYDFANLASLCHAHHSQITRATQRSRRATDNPPLAPSRAG